MPQVSLDPWQAPIFGSSRPGSPQSGAPFGGAPLNASPPLLAAADQSAAIRAGLTPKPGKTIPPQPTAESIDRDADQMRRDILYAQFPSLAPPSQEEADQYLRTMDQVQRGQWKPGKIPRAPWQWRDDPVEQFMRGAFDALSAGLTLGPLGIEGDALRAAGTVARTAGDAEATAAAARVAAIRAARARASGPVVGELNAALPTAAFPVDAAAPRAGGAALSPRGGGGGADQAASSAAGQSASPKPEPAEPSVGRADLEDFRARINVPYRQTVAVARTNVPGLEDRMFAGASPWVRKDAGLPRTIPHPVRTPSEHGFDQGHAEEDLSNQFINAVREQRLKASDLNGRSLVIRVSNPRGVCPPCLWGFDPSKPEEPAGVLKQLSHEYPGLFIRVIVQTQPRVTPQSPINFTIHNETLFIWDER